MDYKTALNKAASLCSRQEYCKSDIRKKLNKWEVPPENCEQILKELTEENFIDESRFTTFFVRDKFRFNRWGRKKIWWHLKQKGLPDDIINEALEQIEEDSYKSTLEDLIREKFRQVQNRDYMKQKAALIRNAVSKGYDYQDVIPIVEQLLHQQKK